MRVLITRPESDCRDIKAAVERAGCDAVVAPLLDIEFCTVPPEALDEANGIVATSRNGLRALAASPALQNALRLPVFVPGSATAGLARQLGFKDIVEGSGTAESLVPVINKFPDGNSRTLLHLSGDHIAFDLEAALKASGPALKRLVVYRSVAAKTLSPAVIELLHSKRLDAVILMSARTARTWASLVAALPFAPDLSAIHHLCLSPAVADALIGSSAIHTSIAPRPLENEIVALVYRLAAAHKTG